MGYPVIMTSSCFGSIHCVSQKEGKYEATPLFQDEEQRPFHDTKLVAEWATFLG